MNIITQNGEVVLNYNNVIGVERNGKDIDAKLIDGYEITLATYQTEERAKEVLNIYKIADPNKGIVVIFPEN